MGRYLGRSGCSRRREHYNKVNRHGGLSHGLVNKQCGLFLSWNRFGSGGLSSDEVQRRCIAGS